MNPTLQPRKPKPQNLTSRARHLLQRLTSAHVETLHPEGPMWQPNTDAHANSAIVELTKHWQESPETVHETILRSLKNARGTINTYETLVDTAAQLIYPQIDKITQNLYHQAQHDPDAATLCARACVYAAYRARGDRYVEQTSPDQIQAFTHYLSCGNEFLDCHPADIRQCPTTITTVLAHMAGMNHNTTMAYALYDDARTTAVDFWPATYWLMQSQRTVWGGDLMQLIGLAEDILAESASGGPQSIAAALASRYLDDPQSTAERMWSQKAKPMVIEQLWSTSHQVLSSWQNFDDPQWSTIHHIFAAQTYRHGFPNLAQQHLQHTTPHLSRYTQSVVSNDDFNQMMADLNLRYAPAIGPQATQDPTTSGIHDHH